MKDRGYRRRVDRRLERRRKRQQSYNHRILQSKSYYLVDTPTPCSCTMCGNPRRHFKEKTRQENIAQQEFIEQLKELDV